MKTPPRTVTAENKPGTNTAVIVDLVEIAIDLQIEEPDGTTRTFRLDVPNAYRLGKSLVEAAERLDAYCTYYSYGEDADPGHRIPDAADAQPSLISLARDSN